MVGGPDRDFAVFYDGWSCLPIVALVEYADPATPAAISQFDMCRQIGWR